MTSLRVVPATPGGNVNTGPGPRATAVVDQNVHSVKLEASPLARAILNDLFDAMHGQGHWLTVGTRTHRTNEARQHVIDRMLDMPAVRAAFDQDITVQAANTLGDDLFDATQEPDYCRVCSEATNNYATVLDLCGICHAVAEDKSPVRFR